MPPQATSNDEGKRIFLHRDSNPGSEERKTIPRFLHRDSNPGSKERKEVRLPPQGLEPCSPGESRLS
jgi:hypothetical protein